MAKEDLNEQVADDFSEDELIVRKKKAPEQKTGVTPEGVLKTAAAALEALRAKGPLVQCMMNAAAANLTANALLALGGSPVMVDDMGEASQGASAADGLLVNLGMVTKPQADAMRAAVSHANMGGRPWVLDPSGVGALPLRTFTAKELMRRFPALIRGTANEINFLVNNVVADRGGEAVVTSDAVAQAAVRLAGVTRAAVIVTGATDYVAAEGAPLVAIESVSPSMPRVAGFGCAQGAVGAAFLGALGGKARWEGALATSLAVAVAGRQAAEKAKGPGSFAAAFLDALYALKPEDVLKRGKVTVVPVEG
ncbi:MAG: hydroxyethylthiazole kinase [Kiritimatiellia bacterium]